MTIIAITYTTCTSNGIQPIVLYNFKFVYRNVYILYIFKLLANDLPMHIIVGACLVMFCYGPGKSTCCDI